MSVSIVSRPDNGVKWSAAHLPMTYELTNTYFPVNSADTTRTISSEANDNGFMQLNLSGSLGTFEALDYVSISGADIPAGNYQIIAKGSSSQITINYPYSSIANTGNVVLYRNNYHILVKVYCGLTAAHIHQALKPYELAATLKFVPDSGNDIKFSINEITKGYIAIKNNLQLSALPNNIDAFCQFYIEYGESYDVSDGDTVSTFTSSFSSDSSNLEGYAVNSKLPFKNTYSGWMNLYVTGLRKFLTLFNEMYLYPGNYMDIGFIIDGDTNVYLVSIPNDNPLNTTYQAIVTTNNAGVFRLPLSVIGNEDSQQVFLAGNVAFTLPAGSWNNGFDSFDPFGLVFLDFFVQTVFGAVSLGYGAQMTLPVELPSGEQPHALRLTISGNVGAGVPMEITISFSETGVGVRLFHVILIPASTGAFNNVYDITSFDVSGPGDSDTMEISVISNVGDSIAIQILPQPYMDYDIISETKTLNIVSDCANQELNICWLNYLGGFDWHVFTTRKTYSIETSNTKTQRKNIFQDWPTSYGPTADTIDRVTKRDSKNILEITSQFVTIDQEDAIKYIMTSPLVQIVNSATDRRTVIVKNTTLPIRRDQDKLRKLSFTLEYTDEIPSQSL